MRKLLTFLIALAGIAFGAMSIGIAHTDGIYNPGANSIGNFEGIDNPKAGSTGGSPAYVFRGSVATTSASANAVTISMDIGTASADRVIAIFAYCQNAAIINSIVVDPTGANVSLTKDTEQDSGTGSGVTTAFWSGLVASGSGVKNIVITYATNPNLFNMGYHVWTLTGLGSNVHRVAASGFPNLSIGVTSGYILLAGSDHTAVPWSSPTQAATSTHVDSGPFTASEDWASISSTGTFTVSISGSWSAVTFF